MVKKEKKYLLIVWSIIILLVCTFLALPTPENKKITKKSKANIVMVANDSILIENDKSAGISNTTNLQKLIDEVHNNGGGTVTIPEGTYYFTVDINDANHQDLGGHYAIHCRDNVLIEGAGMDKTILKPYGEFPHGIDMFYYRDYNYNIYLTNADFKNFTIDGSEGKTTADNFNARGKGFMLDPVKDCDWEKVKVMNTDGTGFGMDLPINCTITDCIAIGNGKAATEEDVGASGFGIGTGLSENESMYIKNCLSIGNRKFGFFFEHQGRFNPDVFDKKIANGKNEGTNITGFVVENSIARGNMHNFGGEKANDVTYKNCKSQNSLSTDPNPLNNSNTSSFYLGLNSRRIHFIDNEVEQKYSDVDENNSKAVYWALNNGIIDGGGKKTKFNPNDSLTNSAAILLIWRMAGRPGEVLIGYGDPGILRTNYDDVGSCQWDQCNGAVYWFIDAVVWGISEDILNNTGNFGPLENISNKDFIYWLWKYSDSPVAKENSFVESEDIELKYVDSLNWALDLGLINKSFVTLDEYERIDAINLLYEYYKMENNLQYLVKFNANGGQGEMDSLKTEDTKQQLPTNNFTKEGYIFKGWNTNASGTGTSYKDKQEISINNNITLYAQWEKIGIKLNKNSLYMKVNYTEKLTVKSVPEDETVKYTWESNDTDIATVDENGKVTAKAIGTTTIKVTSSNGFTDTCEVNIGEFLKGDMDDSGDITITDVIKLLRLYLGLD